MNALLHRGFIDTWNLSAMPGCSCLTSGQMSSLERVRWFASCVQVPSSGTCIVSRVTSRCPTASTNTKDSCVCACVVGRHVHLCCEGIAAVHPTEHMPFLSHACIFSYLSVCHSCWFPSWTMVALRVLPDDAGRYGVVRRS